MSESRATLTVKFPSINEANNIENILRDMEQHNDMSFDEYIISKNLSSDMTFCDSYWFIDKLQRTENILNVQIIGSPSGYCEEEPEREDDFVIWLKLNGAIDISGEFVIDSGGDVMEYKIHITTEI